MPCRSGLLGERRRGDIQEDWVGGWKEVGGYEQKTFVSSLVVFNTIFVVYVAVVAIVALLEEATGEALGRLSRGGRMRL